MGRPPGFRPLGRRDFPLVADWLRAPHVRRWWRDPEPGVDAVEAHYGPAVDGRDPTRRFLIEADGAPAGLIQCYLHADYPEWDRAVGIPGAAGIDYLIGAADHCGRGLGSAAISAFVPVVFGLYPGSPVVVAAPQRANRASCRALEKAGFTLRHEGKLDSSDPADSGISSVYARTRPLFP